MTMKRPVSHLLLCCGISISLTLCFAARLNAQALYDNLHILDNCSEGPGGCWTNVLGTDRRFAQQFLLGDSTSIDEVTVQLARQGENVSGSLSVELWADDGQDDPLLPNDPNRLIDVLGTIGDVSQIPHDRTNYTFENKIMGLQPNTPYWVVVNFGGLTGPLANDNSIGWGHTIWPLPDGVVESGEFINSQGAAGTMGAVSGHLIRLPYEQGWDEIPDLFEGAPFGTDPGYFVMSVSTTQIPEPSSLVLCAVAGLVVSGCSRWRRFQIRSPEPRVTWKMRKR